ncbi:MAG: Na(+)-translocating NADH-quinone reductase subunit C [Gammaproteobacteria bacterium]|nr:MAG: Na(+)-translocating NADH-quinone reductase subunit C [Gammaproteobacteria bacterium]
MEAAGGFKGFIASRLNLPNDDKDKILFVAVALCLVCSVLVSAAAVALRPLQERNAELDRRSNILAVAGLMKPGIDVEKAFEAFEPRLVNLDTGEFTDEISLDEFKQRAAMGDPTLSHELGSDEDSAGIGSRNNYAEVYLLREGDAIDQIIIPVYGKGLWSTLYGYMSLKSDLNTIAGLQFYEHAETPGLGGEVDNPNWRALWHDKVAYDDNGDVALEVIKGTVDRNSAAAEHQVDGLAGASLTTRGVNNLVRFWLGQNGFGPFLRNLNAGGDA